MVCHMVKSAEQRRSDLSDRLAASKLASIGRFESLRVKETLTAHSTSTTPQPQGRNREFSEMMTRIKDGLVAEDVDGPAVTHGLPAYFKNKQLTV